MTVDWHLLDWTGINNVSGRWYGFWSGIGGNWQMLGVLALVYRRHICHTHWCLRLGKHPEGPYMRCAKHHPEVPS